MKRNYLLNHKNGDRVIVTDGCADLTREERIKYGIWPDIAEINVTVADKPVDYSDIDEFYSHLEDGSYPAKSTHTASPDMGAIVDLFENIIKRTPDRVQIHFVSTATVMSQGTGNATRIAISMVSEEHPDRVIVAHDSLCISNGQGLAMQYIANYDGDDFDDYVSFIGRHLSHLFTQTELSYSASSGRYNTLQRFGMLALQKLRISPYMCFPYDDKLSVATSILRGDKILKAWADYYEKHRADAKQPIRIGYGNAAQRERGEKFVRILLERDLISIDQVQWARVGAPIAVHTGPTTLSFFFLQKDDRPRKMEDVTV